MLELTKLLWNLTVKKLKSTMKLLNTTETIIDKSAVTKCLGAGIMADYCQNSKQNNALITLINTLIKSVWVVLCN